LTRGPIIVQHWFYRGASFPRVFGFDDFEEFEEHLKEVAVPGDAFDIWSFNEVCKKESILTEGKLHDKDGCIPKKRSLLIWARITHMSLLLVNSQ